MTKFAQRIMTPLGIFAVVVWWSWAITGLFIGGTADFDQTQNGLYYLSNHGKYTEVEAWVWYYSLIHMCFSFLLWGACLLTSLLLMGIGEISFPNPKIDKQTSRKNQS